MRQLALLAAVLGCQARAGTPPTLGGGTHHAPREAGPTGLTAHDRRRIAVGIAGAGALALTVGVVSGFDALSQRDTARKLGCTADLSACPPSALPSADDAYSRGNLATGFLIGGAVVIGAGIALWLTTHDDDAPSPPTTVWRVTPGIGGVSMSRGF